MIIYCNDKQIWNNISVAKTFWGKFIGLMGQKNLLKGEGLLLMNCSRVHCFFMKIPIDVVYLSKNMEILWIETLNPWEVGKKVKKANHVLEIPAGSTKNILKVGEYLIINE